MITRGPSDTERQRIPALLRRSERPAERAEDSAPTPCAVCGRRAPPAGQVRMLGWLVSVCKDCKL